LNAVAVIGTIRFVESSHNKAAPGHTTPLASAFPRWRRVVAVLRRTRNDLLSLLGVFVTAVALAFANEVSPDKAGAKLGHRVLHAGVVVCSALLTLVLVDFLIRSATYRRAGRSEWEVLTSVHNGVARFVIRSKRSAGDFPSYGEVVLRRPDGTTVCGINNPNVIDGGSAFDSEPGDIEVGSPVLESGRYELRVYGLGRSYEIFRVVFEAGGGNLKQVD
jgi:hypothetical protein